MQFIYPEFLYALAFLLIPIIIHLFNFKRFKTLYFPDVSFLKQVQQKSKSSSKLKHLLVLASRLLMISCLVIAFAQPFLKKEGEILKKGKAAVQIYLDNSFSMQSEAREGRTFEIAKQRAYTIVKSYSVSDQFQILDNSYSADSEIWLNKDAAIEKIQSIEISHENRKLSEVLARLDESRNEEVEQFDIYLISDFQESNFDIEQIDSMKNSLNLVFLEANENDNISLQSMQFDKPFHLSGQSETVMAKVIRHGLSDKKKVPIKLYLEDQLKVPLPHHW
jgi:hypothetical protein